MSDVAETVPADGKDKLDLHRELKADHSMWIAVRAFGKRQEPRNMIVAHTAPVYVVVDGEPTWKASAVPELVAYQRAKLDELMTTPVDPIEDLEPWETRTLLLEEWDKQLPLIKPQINQAHALYQKLLERVNQFKKTAHQ
jgi:hypothetical protein